VKKKKLNKKSGESGSRIQRAKKPTNYQTRGGGAELEAKKQAFIVWDHRGQGRRGGCTRGASRNRLKVRKLE